MSCDAERVTGYVDGALDEGARGALERHLVDCAACREQADLEGALRTRLRAAPRPEPRPGFEDELRRRIREAARPRRLRWALPLAAALALFALWGRGAAPVVALQLARDHGHCFGFETLPAQVWTDDALELARWYEARGQRVPWLPREAAGLTLVGGRRCPLVDRRVAHVYYSADRRRLSLFVVPGTVRLDDTYSGKLLGRSVRLIRLGGLNVGIVAESAEDVAAFERSLGATTALASVDLAPRPW